jgi:hypothetical protein
MDARIRRQQIEAKGWDDRVHARRADPPDTMTGREGYSYEQRPSVALLYLVHQNANELWTVVVCKPWLNGELRTTSVRDVARRRPFFLIIGIHPGCGRVITVRWFEMPAGVLMKQVAMAPTLLIPPNTAITRSCASFAGSIGPPTSGTHNGIR